MVHADALHQFIRSRPHLVWYVRDLQNLSEESLVEHTLNYGTWADFQALVGILGVERTAKAFRKRAKNSRTNYRPEIKNLFQLYFNHYAA